MFAKTQTFHEGYTTLIGSLTQVYLEPLKEKLKNTIGQMKIQEGHVFTFGDYGCYDGFSSKEIVDDVIDNLRQRNVRQMPVHVVYEDLSNNDFTYLIRSTDKGEFLHQRKNLFITLCPTSFYQQCLPNNTFHIIFSAWSVHFLSTSDISYRDSIYKFPDSTEEEAKLVTTQAAADWEKFLLIRAKELKSGGFLMLMMPAEDPKTQYGESTIHLQTIWTSMTQEWRQLKTEGTISESEYRAANYTGYYRNETELRAPFIQDSPVAAAGLYIETLGIVHRRRNTELSKEQTDGTWSYQLVTTVRQWTEYIFVKALSQRDSELRKCLVNIFYERVVNRVEKEAGGNAANPYLDNIIAYLVIGKY